METCKSIYSLILNNLEGMGKIYSVLYSSAVYFFGQKSLYCYDLTLEDYKSLKVFRALENIFALGITDLKLMQ